MPPSVGLCQSCRNARTVRSGKGTTFWLCRKSETDPRFPKYPVLPVLECSGYERQGQETSAESRGP